MKIRRIAECIALGLILVYLAFYWAAWTPDRHDRIRDFLSPYVVLGYPPRPTSSEPAPSQPSAFRATDLYCESCQQSKELLRADRAFPESEGWSLGGTLTEGTDEIGVNYTLHEIGLYDRFLRWIHWPASKPPWMDEGISVSLQEASRRATSTKISIVAPKDFFPGE